MGQHRLDVAGLRIWLTGHTGFLGQHLAAILEQMGVTVLKVPRTKLDLRDVQGVAYWTQKLRPDILIHLAADTGGIGHLRQRPASILTDNIRMSINLMDTAAREGIPRFVSLGSACAYPAGAPLPLDEVSYLDGKPDEANGNLGWTKRLQWLHLRACQEQYGMEGLHIVPTNVYGEFDHFDTVRGHVIPAMMIKLAQAMAEGLQTVTFWGSGHATRDFIHVSDCVRGIVQAIQQWNGSIPLNIASGTETSIRELAELMVRITGYDGSILWDTSMPSGAERRYLSVQRAEAMDIRSTISLEEGLARTWQWYLASLKR